MSNRKPVTDREKRQDAYEHGIGTTASNAPPSHRHIRGSRIRRAAKVDQQRNQLRRTDASAQQAIATAEHVVGVPA